MIYIEMGRGLPEEYDGIVQFSCGNSTLPVYIDNVSLVKKSTSPVKMTKTSKSRSVTFKQAVNHIYWTPISKNTKAMITNINGRVVQPETSSSPISLIKYSKGVYLFIVRDGQNRQVFQIFR